MAEQEISQGSSESIQEEIEENKDNNLQNIQPQASNSLKQSPKVNEGVTIQQIGIQMKNSEKQPQNKKLENDQKLQESEKQSQQLQKKEQSKPQKALEQELNKQEKEQNNEQFQLKPQDASIVDKKQNQTLDENDQEFKGYQKADLLKAEEHQEARRVKDLSGEDQIKNVCQCCHFPLGGKPYELCCDNSKLASLGTGFPLYFGYIKYQIALMIMSFAFGFPMFVACMKKGRDYNQNDDNQDDDDDNDDNDNDDNDDDDEDDDDDDSKISFPRMSSVASY